MSTRPWLDSTAIVVIDVGDQPVAPYVFVIEGLLGPRQAFAVDGYDVQKDCILGFRYDKEFPSHKHTIVAVPIAAPWAVVRRADIIFTTITESAKKRKVDDLAQANFEKELYPPDSEGKATGPSLGYTPGPGVYA
jgi:hypothetical protein